MGKPTVAIVGRPNVGKSTFFNYIVGKRISIVEDTPGVTRDRVYAETNWRGRSFNIVDTGGIEPESDDIILKQMREQANLAINMADVIIFLTDLKQGVTAADREIALMLKKSGKPIVLVCNKADNYERDKNDVYEFYNLGLGEPMPISAANAIGIGDVLDAIYEKFPPKENDEDEDDIIKVAVIGKPNVGKSSLMNLLLGQERAIVTEIAGTTRDTLEEHMSLSGISLHVIDTAGIRDTEDVVEKIGVERALKAAEEGDLIIYVADGSRPLDDSDRKIIEFIRTRKAIVLINKMDLPMEADKKELERLSGKRVIPVSAKEEQGIEELEQEIKTLFYSGNLTFNDQVYITNVRHKEALEHALSSLNLVKNSIEQGMPEDFYSIDLTDAYEELGKIIGEAVEDDVVNEIFSRFCMGK